MLLFSVFLYAGAMLSDRRATRWLNVLCGTLALGAFGTIGALALVRNRAAQAVVRPLESPARLDLREARRLGRDAEQRGDLAEAERRYRSALILRPDLVDVRTGLGRTLVGEGKRREAWELYRLFLEPSLKSYQPPPGGRDALAWYADLATEFGDRKLAIRAARAAIPSASWRTGPQGERLLAWAHLYGGSDSVPPYSALRHIERANELDPRLVPARLQRAEKLEAASRFNEAEAQVAVARRIARSGTAKDWEALADFYSRRGQAAEAKAAFEESIRHFQPSDAAGWLDASESAGWLGMTARSVTLRAKAERTVRSDDGETQLRLVSWYPGQSDHQRRAFAKAAKRATPIRDAARYAAIAEIMESLGDKAEAKTMYRAALSYALPEDRASIELGIARLEGRGGGGYGSAMGTGGIRRGPYGTP